MTKVKMETSKGDIVIELFDEAAPVTVKNFLGYVDDKFYNGTIFHRVIDGFMIQGGGFDASMEQKPTAPPIRNEANNGKGNLRGTIAMARTNDPHSATCQFFINVVDNDFLNYRSDDIRGYGYCVFGQVVEGMETVDAIRKVKTGSFGYFADVPKETVTIKSVVRI